MPLPAIVRHRHLRLLMAAIVPAVLTGGCTLDSATGPDPVTSAQATGELPSVPSGSLFDSDSDGPHYNLNVLLTAASGHRGFGLLFFRQPIDEELIVYLDTWVFFLAPNSRYQLQRATDSVIDGNCTGTNWLTLGELQVPKVIETNRFGTGHALLTRALSVAGPTFDIAFRVINAETAAVVLVSGCHEFTVRM
jgi:hypothetical protein